MGRLGSITRRETIAFHGALGGFVALALACVFCLFAIGGCTDLREDANRRQAHSKAEADAAAAVAMAYTVTEDGNSQPDNPDPGPNPSPHECENCGGSGWVGDGRVFSPCLECNPDGKKPRMASVLTAVEVQPTPDPWPNAPDEVLEEVTQRVVAELLPEVRLSIDRDKLLNQRIDAVNEMVDAIAEQVEIVAETVGARVPDKTAAEVKEEPKPLPEAPKRPLYRIVAYFSINNDCPPCLRCKSECEPAYRASAEYQWETQYISQGPYPRFAFYGPGATGGILKTGYMNRADFDAWVLQCVKRFKASQATQGNSQ